MEIIKVRSTYHIKCSGMTMIMSIALMFSSVAIASAVVSSALTVAALKVNTENRHALEEAKRQLHEILTTFPSLSYAQERSGPISQ